LPAAPERARHGIRPDDLWNPGGLRVRKIRVLHLIKSLNRGGAETLLSEGLRFADRERFELSYAYFHPALDALVPALREHGAQVTCFDAPTRRTMLLRARRVARHLREQRIDLVHCHMPLAGALGRVAGRMAGVPVIYTEHNKVEWYRRATFWLNAWTYGLQAHVIAVSGSVEESIHRYIRPRIPVTVVRNGIDAAHFTGCPQHRAEVRKRLGIPENAPLVGNVAAFIPQKRIHDWIAAARMIRETRPETHFIWVGEGVQRQEMLDQVERHGLQQVVHLAGVQADVRPFLAAMDVYMMASAFEGLPVALLEAMAMECAPVCTAVGGIPEVIREGETGLLAPSGRPELLAAAVGSLLDDPARRSAISSAARREVESEFSLQSTVRGIERIYQDVLSRTTASTDGSLSSSLAG
jgi:L-malate glycosyltransferase